MSTDTFVKNVWISGKKSIITKHNVQLLTMIQIPKSIVKLLFFFLDSIFQGWFAIKHLLEEWRSTVKDQKKSSIASTHLNTQIFP